MTRPDTLSEMESLLASIREAIETETGAAQPDASMHEQASAAQSALAPSETDWQAAHGDDDILWADEIGADAHASAGQVPHDHAALTSASMETPATNNMPRRPAWAMSSTAATSNAAAGVASAASSAPAAAMPSSARRTARLRLVKTDASEQAPSTPPQEAPATTAAPSFLSQKVRERVRAAMARQKRIEEAKRALGGEQALRQLVSDIVEPIIAEWLNEHLPEIVERRVAMELARLRENGD